MKIRWLALGAVLLLNACTYHGQVRRGIYKEPDRTPKIAASVLVLADKNIPSELLITDPENSDMQSFVLKTKDGILVALTDALGTLFQTAHAGSDLLQANYDYVAEVTVEAGLTRTHCDGELAKWAVRKDGLCTLVTLTLRRPEGEKVTGVKSSAWREFRTPGFASSVRWFNKHTFIFSPILTPIYMQAQGYTLRNQLEMNLTDTLNDLLSQLTKQRALFETGTRNKMPETAQNYVE